MYIIYIYVCMYILYIYIYIYIYIWAMGVIFNKRCRCLCAKQIFFSVFAAIIRKNFDKRPWIENGEGHVKNTIFLHACCYGFSQGWKSLYHTVVYKIKGDIAL